VRCARRLAGGVVWLLTWGIDSLKSGSAARAFKAQRTVETGNDWDCARGSAFRPVSCTRTSFSRRGHDGRFRPAPARLVALRYSIAVVSVAGIFLGVLWARNILIVMPAHAAADLIPNLRQFLRAW